MSSPPFTLRRVLYIGALSTALAAVVNLAIYFISGNLFHVHYTIPPPPDSNEVFTVAPANVTLDTVIMGLAATLVFALFKLLLPRPMRLFIFISAVVLLLSFIFPLLLPVDLPMKFALSLMHVAAAVIIVGGFRRLSIENIQTEVDLATGH